MAVDVVASLQLVGADAVAAYQFPVAVVSGRVDGGLSTRRRYRPQPEEPTAPEPSEAFAPVVLPDLFPVLPMADDEEEDEMLLAATVLLMQ